MHALAICPNSQILQKNMAVFKESWAENLSLLNDHVGAITPLHDIMAVTELHISEDRSRFLTSVDSCHIFLMRESIELMHGRCAGMLRRVQADLRGNPDCYIQGLMRQVNSSARSLRKKSKEHGTAYCDNKRTILLSMRRRTCILYTQMYINNDL